MMKKKNAVILNFFGGPGTGKSTMAAGVFAELKSLGLNTELSLEYAKDKVYEKSLMTLDNQIYVFGKQLHRNFRIIDQVDVIVTDAPILMSIHYGSKESFIFKALVLEQHNKYPSLNVFLERNHKYNPNGRIQTEEQAEQMDFEMKSMLDSNRIQYICMKADKANISELVSMVENKLARCEGNNV